eukprot:1194916-Prorocentrum_minimum.AAC.3
MFSRRTHRTVVPPGGCLFCLRAVFRPVLHGQIYAPARSYNDPQHFGGYLIVLHPSMDTAKQLKVSKYD